MDNSKYIFDFDAKFIKSNNTMNNDIMSIIKKAIYESFLSLSKNKKLNLDIANNPLINKCDLVRDRIVDYLTINYGNYNLEIMPLETQDIIDNDVTGHSILIVSLNNKNYLVDPTYSQFFLKENCSKENYMINHERRMVLLAPDPGYYYLTNPSHIKVAKEIIENGVIELTEETAKIYFDSFNKTKRGYSGYLNLTNEAMEISGQVYLNSIAKLKENNKALF